MSSLRSPTHAPPDKGKVTRLERLRVVVEDRDRYLKNLTDLIDEGSRSGIYALSEDARGKRGRISLRGLELEYVEPTDAGAEADHLERYGPGITTAVFSVPDIGRWADRHLSLRATVGLDVEVEG
jgi:hypothetical protein